MKLFLDDFRLSMNAYEYTKNQVYLLRDWVLVKNYDEFTTTIAEHYSTTGKLPELISFDHDLADEHYAPADQWEHGWDSWASTQTFVEKTGYDCAKWLIEFCIDNDCALPEFLCHSMNPAGKQNILSLLTNFKKQQ